jgi:hypothetical protein
MNIEEFENLLRKKYTISSTPVSRSYLFPDGTFLALDSFNSHQGVQQWLIDNGYVKDSDELHDGGCPTLEDLGAMRINLLDEGFIMLSQVPPTEVQYIALSELLDKRMHSTWKWRDGILIIEPHQKENFKEFNTNGKDSDYIIGIIRHYYETGHLTEPMGEAKGDPSLKESEDDFINVVTYQSPLVKKMLLGGHEYIASYSNIFNKDYLIQYKNLSKYLGFKNCPIFAVLKSDEARFKEGKEGSGSLYAVNKDSKRRIELLVPANEVREVDYYGWTDYLYFSSTEDPDVDKGLKTSRQALNNIQLYLGNMPSNADIQVLLDRIKPEWVVEDGSLDESEDDFNWGTGKVVGDNIFDTSTLGWIHILCRYNPRNRISSVYD